MRICMVSDSYYPHPGGVTEHIHHAATELRRRGHTVKILTAEYGNNLGYEGPHIERIGRAIKVPINKSFATITIGLRIPGKVREYLQGQRFDIIHTHGPLAPTLPFFALRHSDTTNIATFHAARETTPHYFFLSPLLRDMFRKIDGLIAVSDVAQRSIARYFPGDYTIIPNGVDTRRFHPGLEPIPDFNDGRPNILFVGRMDRRKGLPHLISAMPKILERIPEARLLVVGNGLLRKYYQKIWDKRVKEAVEFVGYVEPDLLPRFYASADLYCSPATGSESFGITILEAMAAGTPVVAFGIDGFRCVVEDRKDGVLVSPLSSEALAVAILEVLQNADLAGRLSENGLDKARRHSWDKIAGFLEDYYQETIAKAASR